MRQNKGSVIENTRLAAATIAAVVLLFTACSEIYDPTDPEQNAGVTLPTTAQISLDLPASLAPPTGAVTASPQGTAVQTERPPCDDEEYPGGTFACVTRFIFAKISTNFGEMMSGLLAEIAEVLEVKNIPKGVVISFSHAGFDVKARWDQGANSTDYNVDFIDPSTSAQVGHWEWSITDDGNASGLFKVLPAVLSQVSDDPMTYGLLFSFESNQDGSEKSINMDLDLGDTPPDGDSSPTSLKLTAVKSDGMWDVAYGMYFPTWLNEDVPGGFPTVILVSAAGGVAEDSPSVMNIVALDADLTSVPPDAEENNAICDYVTPLLEAAGVIPPGFVTCGDNNPYYLHSDGSIQEGGPVPTGFESLAAELSQVGFVLSNPTHLRDLAVSF